MGTFLVSVTGDQLRNEIELKAVEIHVQGELIMHRVKTLLSTSVKTQLLNNLCRPLLKHSLPALLSLIQNLINLTGLSK